MHFPSLLFAASQQKSWLDDVSHIVYIPRGILILLWAQHINLYKLSASCRSNVLWKNLHHYKMVGQKLPLNKAFLMPCFTTLLDSITNHEGHLTQIGPEKSLKKVYNLLSKLFHQLWLQQTNLSVLSSPSVSSDNDCFKYRVQWFSCKLNWANTSSNGGAETYRQGV